MKAVGQSEKNKGTKYQAVGKVPLTSEAVKEFQALINDTLRLEYELAENREMRRDLLPEIQRIEEVLGKAERGAPPIVPEDLEKLPADDRAVVIKFVKLFEGEQRKKAALKKNQKAAKAFVKRYVNLSLPLD